MGRVLSSRGALAVALAASLGLVGLAVAGGDAATAALRALTVVAVLGLGAAVLRRRRTRTTVPSVVSVVESHMLTRDTGVAVLAAEGRRLLVGFGPGGAALLRDLDEHTEAVP